MSKWREPPLMTDHAVIRYAERVLGIPVRQAVEERVFADRRRAGVIRKLPRGRMRLGDSDVVLVIENGTVVTVVVRPDSKGRPPTEPRLEHP